MHQYKQTIWDFKLIYILVVRNEHWNTQFESSLQEWLEKSFKYCYINLYQKVPGKSIYF